MARDPFKKELFISSCLNPPTFIEEKIREIQKEQEEKLMKEVLGIQSPSEYLSRPAKTYFTTEYLGFADINPYGVVKIDIDEKETNKMEAKKCDRCGKLYEKKFDKNDIRCIFKYEEPFFEREEKNYSKEFIDEKKTHDVFVKRGNGDYIDMCPDCRKAFKKWFEES